MSPQPVRGIDHLVLCVRDLDQARRRFSQAGFSLTPRARHPFGTANSLVQLERSFLELLAVADPQLIESPGPGKFSFADFNRRFLARGEGMSMLVFHGCDADADHAEFTKGGLRAFPPFHFSREATMPDGSTATVGFSLVFVIDDSMPDIAFFTCWQHAPEHFWKPEYQVHRNGAMRVQTVWMVADDPVRHAGFWRRLIGPDCVDLDDRTLTVRTGWGNVVMQRSDQLAGRFPGRVPTHSHRGPRFAGATIVVRDPAEAATCLSQNGVHFLRRAGSIRVPPSDLFGFGIELIAD